MGFDASLVLFFSTDGNSKFPSALDSANELSTLKVVLSMINPCFSSLLGDVTQIMKHYQTCLYHS